MRKFFEGMFWVAMGLLIYVVFFGPAFAQHPYNNPTMGELTGGLMGGNRGLMQGLPPLQWQPQGTTVYPTIPGTSSRDWGRGGYILEGNNWYPTLPGTNLKDLGRSGFVFEDNIWYPTVPGTRSRDLNRPGYIIQSPLYPSPYNQYP